mgnify:CR=1 FL=1
MATPATLTTHPVVPNQRDLEEIARTMGTHQARALVDMYYAVQNFRMRAANQKRALTEADEPTALMAWSFVRMEETEQNIARFLSVWTKEQPAARWMQTITGIGPILSAGLLAHINIEMCPTVGHLWRFAGLDPTNRWLGKEGAEEAVKGSEAKLTPQEFTGLCKLLGRKPEGVWALSHKKGEEFGDYQQEDTITKKRIQSGLAKRPWNAKLKVLTWKLGKSFVMVSSKESDVYGKVYLARKARELRLNEEGKCATQAAAILKAKRWSSDTEARAAYEKGRLPLGHLDARARRYAVKLFLAGLHEVMYFYKYGKLPPKPYILTQPDHTHWFQAPNADVVPGLREAQEAARKGLL